MHSVESSLNGPFVSMCFWHAHTYVFIGVLLNLLVRASWKLSARLRSLPVSLGPRLWRLQFRRLYSWSFPLSRNWWGAVNWQSGRSWDGPTDWQQPNSKICPKVIQNGLPRRSSVPVVPLLLMILLRYAHTYILFTYTCICICTRPVR